MTTKNTTVVNGQTFGKNENTPVSVLRWMGKNGFSNAEAAHAIEEIGITVARPTVNTQVHCGRKGLRGAPAKLTRPEQSQLRKIRTAFRKAA